MKKPVSSYSKGMRQRTSMARALLNNPKLLFLDEPTSGLDPTGAVLFRRIIEQERSKGTTIFLTTHDEVGKAFSFLYDEILQVHSQEPTLEDIFLQYTGRGLQ